jgi:hypothetical protein
MSTSSYSSSYLCVTFKLSCMDMSGHPCRIGYVSHMDTRGIQHGDVSMEYRGKTEMRAIPIRGRRRIEGFCGYGPVQ